MTLDDLLPLEVELAAVACPDLDLLPAGPEHLVGRVAAYAPELAARLVRLHPDDLRILHEYVLDRWADAELLALCA